MYGLDGALRSAPRGGEGLDPDGLALLPFALVLLERGNLLPESKALIADLQRKVVISLT